MTDREKLVEIVCNAIQEVDCISHCNHPPCYKVHHVVDELISHGVTVKEPQKPLTVEEVRAKQNEIVYLEYAQNKLEEFPVLLAFFGAFYAEFEKYVGEGIDFPIDEYGYKWRCWAERPTDAERKNAKWEE